MWWFLACSPSPDADALLRAGKVDEALVAAGSSATSRMPSVDALSRRARGEPWITVPVILDFAAADALLSAAPTRGLQSLDVTFDRWQAMGACTAARLITPWRVAVGRSAVPADPDPYQPQGPFAGVPYEGGRIVGAATLPAELDALFAQLDARPPARRVTVVLADERGRLAVHLEHRDAAWWAVSANDAVTGAAWIAACGAG